MGIRLSERFEELFTVKQTKHTNGRLLFTFLLVFVAAAILPLYFRYEDYTYAKYKAAYQEVKAAVEEFHAVKGEYPIGHPIQWDNEKQLKAFFSKGRTHGRLYYVDVEQLTQLKELKYTYLIDIDRGTLYTSQFIAYRLERWHMGTL